MNGERMLDCVVPPKSLPCPVPPAIGPPLSEPVADKACHDDVETGNRAADLLNG
jgi:hypothetical protein